MSNAAALMPRLKRLYKTSSAGILLLVFPLAVLGLFFIVPVLSILGNITAADFLDTLTNPYYRYIIGFTFLQAAVSTISAVLIGLPGAWIMSHFDFPGKRLVSSLTTIPFVLPSVLVVLGFVLSFGNSGILNSVLMKITGAEDPPLRILYSFKAIILAHTFYNFPISLRLVSSAWSRIGRYRLEAAEVLGAGRLRIFRTITLPFLMPSIIAAASLIFLFCFMSFAVILVLGGGPGFTTIEVEIYRLSRISLDLEAAASLALAGAVLTAALTYLYIRIQKKASTSLEDTGQPVPLKKMKTALPLQRVFLVFYISIIVILILGPLAAVLYRSFQSRAGWAGDLVFSIKPYLTLAESITARSAVRNTLFFAAASMLISLPAGLSAAYSAARKKTVASDLTETLFMLPMGVSAVVIGLGYYSIARAAPFLSDSRSVLIIFAHAVISLPFVVRTFTTGIRRINTSLLQAAQTLGAGPLRVFATIELPLLKSSIVSAAAFAFCISAGEINAALILSDGMSATIPIAVYRLISSYNFFAACAMGSVLMLICGAAFYLIDKFGGRDLF